MLWQEGVTDQAAIDRVLAALTADDSSEVVVRAAETALRRFVEANVADIEALDMDTPLMDAGIDSLLATAMADDVNDALMSIGIDLSMPSTLLFECSSIRQIADCLRGRAQPQLTASV